MESLAQPCLRPGSLVSIAVPWCVPWCVGPWRAWLSLRSARSPLRCGLKAVLRSVPNPMLFCARWSQPPQRESSPRSLPGSGAGMGLPWGAQARPKARSGRGRAQVAGRRSWRCDARKWPGRATPGPCGKSVPCHSLWGVTGRLAFPGSEGHRSVSPHGTHETLDLCKASLQAPAARCETFCDETSRGQERDAGRRPTIGRRLRRLTLGRDLDARTELRLQEMNRLPTQTQERSRFVDDASHGGLGQKRKSESEGCPPGWVA